MQELVNLFRSLSERLDELVEAVVTRHIATYLDNNPVSADEDTVSRAVERLDGLVEDVVTRRVATYLDNNPVSVDEDTVSRAVDSYLKEDGLETVLGTYFKHHPIFCDNINGLDDVVDREVEKQFQDIEINADDVHGLDDVVENEVEKQLRNAEIEVDADKVNGLDDAIDARLDREIQEKIADTVTDALSEQLPKAFALPEVQAVLQEVVRGILTAALSGIPVATPVK